MATTAEGKPILEWVGCSCPWCGWQGRVEMTEKDTQGRSVVRCPQCQERIRLG